MSHLKLNHNLKHFVSHIDDDMTALKVAKALLNCTPAHALMELVRNDNLDIMLASQAYKLKYGLKTVILQREEQAENEYEKQMGI
jgi:hypothetical protein